MAQKAKKENIVVTVSGDRPIRQVAKDLKAAGMNVDQVLEFTGTVTGSASSETHQKLRSVSGVSDVSHDQAVDIGPPGADIS